MNEFVLNGLVKRRASVTRAPKPRKINEQKTAFASDPKALALGCRDLVGRRAR